MKCEDCDPKRPYGGRTYRITDADDAPFHLCRVHRLAIPLWLRGYNDDVEMAEALIAEEQELGLRVDISGLPYGRCE